MNSRIKLIKDTEVRIQRRDPCRPPGTILAILDNGCLNLVQDGWFDAEGRDALIDALQCLRDSGSFAALADTSDVPFTGKRMLIGTAKIEGVVLVHSPESKWPYFVRCPANLDRHSWWDAGNLSPLTAPEPPQPKWRKFTRREAVDHIGRTLSWPGDSLTYVAKSVSLDGMRFDEKKTGGYMWVSYESLANDHTWADTSEPCGVQIEAST